MIPASTLFAFELKFKPAFVKFHEPTANLDSVSHILAWAKISSALVRLKSSSNCIFLCACKDFRPSFEIRMVFADVRSGIMLISFNSLNLLSIISIRSSEK